MQTYKTITLSIIFFSHLYSQQNNIKFEHISLEQGLSQSSISTIIQDRKGFLWFGTYDGLNKYDGYNFTVYRNNPSDSKSISENWITALDIDTSGTFWIGTGTRGLNSYDKEKREFKHYKNNPTDINSLSNNEILSIYHDRNGTVWIGTADGLNKFNKQTSNFNCYKSNLKNINDPSNTTNTIYEDKSGIFWVGTNSGLKIFDREKEKFINCENFPQNPDESFGNRVFVIIEDNSGLLWFGTSYGLIKYDKSQKKFRLFTNINNNPNCLSNNDIKSIYVDESNLIWIATYGGGLEIFNPMTEGFIHHQYDPYNPNSISSNNLRIIYRDKSNILWIGTDIGGLNKYDRKKERFRHYRSEHITPWGLNNNIIIPIYEDRSETIWFGTWGGGLNKFDLKRNKVKFYLNKPDDPTSLSDNSVWSIFEDRTGILWIGTVNGGLNKFNKKTEKFIHYTNKANDPKSLIYNYVKTIYEDKYNNLWIGTDGKGLELFDRKKETFKHFKNDPQNKNSLSSNSVISIIEDKENNLWVGTDGGLNKFDRIEEKFTVYKNNPSNPNSIGCDVIRVIFEDSEGTIWIGTQNGLNKFDKKNESFTRYSENDGLPNNVIYGILEDDKENLWLSTNKGLSKFNPKFLTFRNYDVNDGLQSNEFNQKSYFKNSKGEMIFGGINGFNIFHPDSIKDNPYIPSIVITAFRKFDKTMFFEKDILEMSQIELTHYDNFFSIEFVALDYSNPIKNQYAYKLEGFDKDWIYCDNRRFASYTNLNGGEYIFRVKGSNNDGVWNEEGTSIKIIITPPFWGSWWFRILIIVFIIIIIISNSILRTKKIKKQKKNLEILVAKRTRELKQKKEELEKINNIVNSINSEINFNDLLQSILEQTKVIKGVERATSLIHDKEAGLFRFIAKVGWDEKKLENVYLTLKESENAFTIGVKEIYDDIFIMNDQNITQLNQKFEEFRNSKSILVMRIKLDNIVEGYFIFENLKEENAFGNNNDNQFTSQEDKGIYLKDTHGIELLINLKGHIISAFQKAKMLEEFKIVNDNKNLFLGIAAHDLLNPLTIINTYVKMLSQHIKEDSLKKNESIDQLEEIITASERMRLLLSDLLDISALDSGKFNLNLQETNLPFLINSSIEFHKTSANQKNIKLISTIDYDIPSFLIDKERIAEVLDNLLSNAIKYTPPGGEVRIFCELKNGEVITHVQDNGQGLTEEDLKQIFKSFKKLSAKPTAGESSTGLGLMIVKKIVEMHNGKVQVKSKKNEGSIFSFSLPTQQNL